MRSQLEGENWTCEALLIFGDVQEAPVQGRVLGRKNTVCGFGGEKGRGKSTDPSRAD